jgi:hypothetical protein
VHPLILHCYCLLGRSHLIRSSFNLCISSPHNIFRVNLINIFVTELSVLALSPPPILIYPTTCFADYIR